MSDVVCIAMRRPSIALCVVAAAACGGTAPESSNSTTTSGGTARDESDESDASNEGTGRPRTAGEWGSAAALPFPLQETAVVALAGRMHVLGGVDDAGTFVDAHLVYDAEADAWSEAAALPEALHHANAAVAEGKIYVAGYLVGSSFAASGRTHVYDPSTDVWSEGPELPSFRGAAGAASDGRRIAIVGGFRSGRSTDLASIYDTDANTWTVLAPLPRARDHLAAWFGPSGALYAVGGRTDGITNHTAEVWRLADPDANWQAAAPMPTARAGFAAAAFEGQLYVFGGEGDTKVATGVFDAVERFDPTAGTWQALPPMNTPRHGMGAATLGSTIFIPGGAPVQAFGATDLHEAYVLGVP